VANTASTQTCLIIVAFIQVLKLISLRLFRVFCFSSLEQVTFKLLFLLLHSSKDLHWQSSELNANLSENPGPLLAITQ